MPGIEPKIVRGSSRRAGFFGLEGNAKICIALLPLWGIPYSFYFFYLSLYFREFGVSDGQLGTLTFVGSAASMIFSFFAGPLVDRMGRKRSTLVFDLLGSAVPPLIFAISGNFAFAVAGLIIANSNKIMSIGYYLLMSEDADDDARVTVFNLFNIIIVAAGVFIPATAPIIERFGVVRTERTFLVLSCVSMTALALVRNRLVKETRIGEKIMKNARANKLSVRAMIDPYQHAAKYLGSHPAAAAAAAANIFFYMYYIIGTNNSLYFAPFFGDALGMNAADSSVLGSIYAAGMLFAMIVVNPFARRFGIVTNAIAGSALNAAGLIALICAPKQNFAWAICAIVVTSIGYGILKTSVDAAIVITTEGEERSGVYSIANFLSALLGIGASALCGAFYGREPRSIYILSLTLLAAIAISFGAAARAKRRQARQSQ